MWLEARAEAQARHGADFDLKAFHAYALDLGPLGPRPAPRPSWPPSEARRTRYAPPMADVTIYHNPRAARRAPRWASSQAATSTSRWSSTSRHRSTGPASRRCSTSSTSEPADLVRHDKRFDELGLDPADYTDRQAVVDLLVEYPELMQRPILVSGRAGGHRPAGRRGGGRVHGSVVTVTAASASIECVDPRTGRSHRARCPTWARTRWPPRSSGPGARSRSGAACAPPSVVEHILAVRDVMLDRLDEIVDTITVRDRQARLRGRLHRDHDRRARPSPTTPSTVSGRCAPQRVTTGLMGHKRGRASLRAAGRGGRHQPVELPVHPGHDPGRSPPRWPATRSC